MSLFSIRDTMHANIMSQSCRFLTPFEVDMFAHLNPSKQLHGVAQPRKSETGGIKTRTFVMSSAIIEVLDGAGGEMHFHTLDRGCHSDMNKSNLT